jgi:hypothetical protein
VRIDMNKRIKDEIIVKQVNKSWAGGLLPLFSAAGFSFQAIEVNNGAILYFRAVKC